MKKLLLICLSLFLVSCVSVKKFNKLQSEVKQLKKNEKNTKSDQENLREILYADSYNLYLAMNYYESNKYWKALYLFKKTFTKMQKSGTYKKRYCGTMGRCERTYWLSHYVLALTYAKLDMPVNAANTLYSMHINKRIGEIREDQTWLKYLAYLGLKFWKDPAFKSLYPYPKFRFLLRVYTKENK